MSTPEKRQAVASRVRTAFAAAILAIVAAGVRADTYTVTNTNDSGAGSLHQAMLDANAHVGTDTIGFNIPGSGVHTIAIATNLPTITDPTVIDGSTQPGYVGNPLIELSTATGHGFVITGGNSTLRGLVLNGSGGMILLQTGGGNVVEGCYIGTDATGTVDLSNDQGIRILSSNNNRIGGTSPSSRNLISGNDAVGLLVETSDGTIIQGNLIGTDISGSFAIPNGHGVDLSQSNNAVIGGSAAGARNVIAGNLGSEISQVYGSGHVIQGNFIGTDITGTKSLGPPSTIGLNVSAGDGLDIGGSGAGEGNLISGNGVGIYIYNFATNTTVFGNLIGTDVTGTLPVPNVNGVLMSNLAGGAQIGGTGPGEANVIAFSSGSILYSVPSGVVVTSANQVPIRGNSIHDNARIGIDFNGSGPNPNDPGDADTGPNALQNFPIVRAVTHLGPETAGSTEVAGKLDSAASTSYWLDFYSNASCSRFPRDFDEGETYLGSTQVTTDAAGHKDFDVTLPVATVAGARITVTATDPAGNTSEFSQRIIFSISPTSGPAAGGDALTIFGTDFSNPTSIAIGGVAAPQTYVSDHQLYSASPAIAPGTVNDVVVTTEDGTTGTLVNGWVSDFLDVDASHQFHSYVTTLVSNAITVGVGQGLYGVDQPTLRRQMAVFLLKARHGLCYAPPPCTGTVFLDVPCQGSPFDPWIEALTAEGITGGCGNGDYCPTTPVRRDQMAVFLLKAEHGPAYVPPPCAGIYGDVACPSTFANWIEHLSAEQITGGCGGGNYCPGNANTRGQMAVFIVKTFGLK